jgi:hypothetical protein
MRKLQRVLEILPSGELFSAANADSSDADAHPKSAAKQIPTEKDVKEEGSAAVPKY